MITVATDPRIEGWLFMSSIKPLVAILICYAAMAYYGRKWMAIRPPFNLKYILVIYDVTVASLSLYTLCLGLPAIIRLKYNWLCEPVHYNAVSDDEMAIVKCAHLFFICKLIELMDTVFYILRKREDQLVAAHYHHHVSIITFSYIGARWSPGGSLFFMPLLNSFIHFTFYINHCLTVLGSSFIRSSLWKNYIFISIVLQALLAVLHSLLAILTGCETARYFNYTLATSSLLYIILHTINVRRNGSVKRISDVMSYSTKVNNE